MKKTILIIFALLFSRIGLAQITSSLYDKMLKGLLDHTAREIGVSKAVDMKDTAQFVDAREKAEFNVSHINGACWVGYEDFDMSRLSDLDKNRPVIVYCSVGYRSEQIALKLENAGFSDVYNLYGGIFEWKNQGHAVVDTSGKPTEKVHAYSRVWGIWLDKGDKVY